MGEYIGLDVSLKETAISVRRAGKRTWRGKCASDPKLLADMIRKHAPQAERVVFETGPLSVWFYHALNRPPGTGRTSPPSATRSPSSGDGSGPRRLYRHRTPTPTPRKSRVSSSTGWPTLPATLHEGAKSS